MNLNRYAQWQPSAELRLDAIHQQNQAPESSQQGHTLIPPAPCLRQGRNPRNKPRTQRLRLRGTRGLNGRPLIDGHGGSITVDLQPILQRIDLDLNNPFS